MNLPGYKNRKGQPLLVLALILLGWIGARSALWTFSTAGEVFKAEPAGSHRTIGPATPSLAREPQTSAPDTEDAPAAAGNPVERPMIIVPLHPGNRAQPPPVTSVPPRIAAGHRLLFLAGMSAIPVPQPERAAGLPLGRTLPAAPPALREDKISSRWSGDAWVLWRQGGNGWSHPGRGLPAQFPNSSAYGASQAGIVLRYRLAPGDSLKTAIYLRASSGMERPRGEELAAGVALRPLAKVPITVLGEVRALNQGERTVLRPAVAMVTELPAVALPLGLRGEAYGQAGWVGGKDHTPFGDGQLRIDKRIAARDRTSLSLGAGAWVGVQSGSSRLDVGPSVRVDLPLGGTNARVTGDYRWRVGGRAAPGSGAAITFSAGF